MTSLHLRQGHALSTHRRRPTTARLVIVVIALAAALLVGWSVFGRIPPTGRLVDTTASPDGRWIASTYDIEEGGVLGVVTGRVELRAAAGQHKSTEVIYYGMSVGSVRWLANDAVVVTEGQSGTDHVLRVPGDSYDYRVDDPSNFVSCGALVIGAGAIAGLLAWGGIGLWRRGSGRKSSLRPKGSNDARSRLDARSRS